MFTKIYEKIKSFIVENYKLLLILLFLIILFKVELPYVIYKPGGSINLNDRVKLEGGYKSKGSLEMAYVSLVKGNLPFLGIAAILPNWDIAPKSEVALDGESLKEALEKDKLLLKEAIDNATIVAFESANKDLKINNIINNVIYIADEADTNLQIYDEIIKIDNQVITSLDDIKNIINTKQENDIVEIVINNDDKELVKTAKVYKTKDGLKIGVSIVNTYNLITEPEINIKTKRSESGPSGGLMLSLSIYNALVEEDITKDRKIVGTGTIDAKGIVGAIGGVKYKLMGAVNNDADIFLCPKENYDEALEVKKEKEYDIDIVSVETFEDALNYLINS